MTRRRRARNLTIVAAGLASVGLVAQPASATPLSGPASPPNNAQWGNAAHGEQLGPGGVTTGDVVAFWQGFLASYSSVPCPSGINGRFDANTVAGTRAIQGFFGLAKDGIVGVNTWNAAGTWLDYIPYSSSYDEWTPYNSGRSEITYFHALPSGTWKWSSGITTDFPSLHSSDAPGISFTNSGLCP
jgi:peptidoglycan hydrolase-like protein with peptidoglycan-binding domain